MDIEDLNKTQLLLLTLLVNFVTSIATGVLTVALLTDTSPTVTQTVNRIVERTVESVAEAPVTIPTITPPRDVPASTPTEEERRTAAVAGVSARTVELYRSVNGKSFVATGTYLPKSKAVVAVGGAALPADVAISFPTGEMIEASRSKSGNGLVIYGFADTATLPAAPATSLVASTEVKQGQTVVGILPDRSAVTGMVTKADTAGVTATVTGIPTGAAIVNLSGSIIGISNGTGTFIPAQLVNNLLAAPSS